MIKGSFVQGQSGSMELVPKAVQRYVQPSSDRARTKVAAIPEGSMFVPTQSPDIPMAYTCAPKIDQLSMQKKNASQSKVK